METLLVAVCVSPVVCWRQDAGWDVLLIWPSRLPLWLLLGSGVCRAVPNP